MYENEINQNLKNVASYLGSFALDELNEIKISTFPIFLVINLDTRSEIGSHWIALAIYMTDIYLCDSLGGIKPTTRMPNCLINFLHRLVLTRKLHMTCRLQPIESDLCGYYCILFVKEMFIHNCFSEFLSLFTRDTSRNDEIVKFLNKRK